MEIPIWLTCLNMNSVFPKCGVSGGSQYILCFLIYNLQFELPHNVHLKLITIITSGKSHLDLCCPHWSNIKRLSNFLSSDTKVIMFCSVMPLISCVRVKQQHPHKSYMVVKAIKYKPSSQRRVKCK